MNQYCYDIRANVVPDAQEIKDYVLNLYSKKKLKDLAFGPDEKIPLIVLYSEKDQQVCVKMTSKAKKNVDRIEAIHSKLTLKDLTVSDDIQLDKPVLFALDQCAWWDTDCIGKESQKWTTLIHNGPYFTHLMEPYEPHGAPLIYNGVKYVLTPEEERIANFYARRIISENAGNVIAKLTADPVFNKNFWDDFQKYLTPAHAKVFKIFSKIDFSPIVQKLTELKEDTKQVSTEEKNAKKVKVAERKQNFGYAIINGIREPVGNFTIEPAALFFGRGENPKRGKIKRDIEPEEVTINIQEGKTVQPPAGHTWKKVIHDHNAAWIASWKDAISGENKYVYLGAEGQLKGKSDYVKYEKARKLNSYLDKVREKYTRDITSKSAKTRQLGTVLYLIDNYGLRVGNEKDDTDTDTVGASTLRVEHVSLQPPDKIVFDFLGKDSIRYYKELEVSTDVFNNIQFFMKSKKPTDSLFHLISATDINAYLKTFDKDFSAKVFRTRLASTIMDNALRELKIKKSASADEKKKLFTKANVQVAEILNHQRTVSAKAQETIKKYQQELKDLKKLLKETKNAGKSTKTIETRIQKKQDQIDNKNDTLNVAITTSLTNYIDPRIVVAWAKENDVSMPKVYSATLQRKFKWAIDITDPEWNYTETELLPVMATLQPETDKKKQVVKPVVKSVAKPVVKPVVKSVAKPVVKSVAKPVVKSVAKPVVKSVAEPVAQTSEPVVQNARNISIVDYTEKSIAVIGDTKSIKDDLLKLGGKFNKFLTINNVKVPGWIFSKNKLGQVSELLGDLSQSIINIMSVNTDLTDRERNIIKCFAQDANVVEMIKEELTTHHDEKSIISIEFLAHLLACLESYDQEPTVQEQLIEKYTKLAFTQLASMVINQLAPGNVPLYMFLVFLLYKSTQTVRQMYIQKLLARIENKQDIQKCLCDNKNDKNTLDMSAIPMKDLYLTNTGQCMHLYDVATQIANNINTDFFWSNEQEKEYLLNRIKNFDLAQYLKIMKKLK